MLLFLLLLLLLPLCLSLDCPSGLPDCFSPLRVIFQSMGPICLRQTGEGYTHLLHSGLTVLLWLTQRQGTRCSLNKGHLSWNGPSMLSWEEFIQARQGDKPIHCVAQPLYFVSKRENTHYFLWLLGFPYLLLVCYHSGEGKGRKQLLPFGILSMNM